MTTEALPSTADTIKRAFLTIYLAPKQIFINAHIDLRDDPATVTSNKPSRKLKRLIERAEPTVDLIFLETARQRTSEEKDAIPRQIGQDRLRISDCGMGIGKSSHSLNPQFAI